MGTNASSIMQGAELKDPRITVGRPHSRSGSTTAKADQQPQAALEFRGDKQIDIKLRATLYHHSGGCDTDVEQLL